VRARLACGSFHWKVEAPGRRKRAVISIHLALARRSKSGAEAWAATSLRLTGNPQFALPGVNEGWCSAALPGRRHVTEPELAGIWLAERPSASLAGRDLRERRTGGFCRLS